jgi:hypothetical protein
MAGGDNLPELDNGWPEVDYFGGDDGGYEGPVFDAGDGSALLGDSRSRADLDAAEANAEVWLRMLPTCRLPLIDLSFASRTLVHA